MVKFFFLCALASVMLALPERGNAQPASGSAHVRSSAAYSEILLRKTELQADLAAFLENYTEVNPRVLDIKVELAALEKENAKVLTIRPSDAGKLTLGLGKLIVRKAEIETELSRLLRSYSDEHPEVKRAKRRVDIFEKAIREVIP